MELRSLDYESEEHRDAVWSVFESDAGFSLRAQGRGPDRSDVAELFTAVPPGMPAESKRVLGFWQGPVLVGIVDVVRGYPDSSVAYIGLLQVAVHEQGKGMGKRIFGDTEALVREWPEIIRLRLSVVRDNWAASGFWRRMGFTETGEVRKYARQFDTSEAVIFEKVIRG